MARPWGEADRTRWLAVSQRDPAANASFLYGVTSTQIFCRPTCPGRVARRANVVFFDNLHDAWESGYRPCKRCQPANHDWSRESQHRLVADRAGDLIATAVVQGVPWTVQGIAKNLGVSGAHLHRLFKKCHGFTPKVFASLLQEAAKEPCELYDPTSVTNAQCPLERSQPGSGEWLLPPGLAAISPTAVFSEPDEDGGFPLCNQLPPSVDSSVFVDDLELGTMPNPLDIQDLSFFFDYLHSS